MPTRLTQIVCACMALAPGLLVAQYPGGVTAEAYHQEMLAELERAPRSRFVETALPLELPPGLQLGLVSWTAVDKKGLVYLLHRGAGADPIVVLDAGGRVVRSWGAGQFLMPHAIRLDKKGNLWTTDAQASVVTQFASDGTKLLEIRIGGVPEDCGKPNPFCGVTDVAFGPNGHIYVADGYRNARVLEYSPTGTRIREWSAAVPGEASFARAHSIAVDREGTVYVADRNNGRVLRFTSDGKFIGEWSRLGRPYALALVHDGLWVATLPVVEPWDPGFLIKVDPKNGGILEYMPATGIHGLHASSAELLVAPGPGRHPRIFR